jgi:2-keto-4-pentenoate hydratase
MKNPLVKPSGRACLRERDATPVEGHPMHHAPGSELSDSHVEALASALRTAAETRRPVRPLTGDRPGLSVEAAYQVQRAGIAAFANAGVPASGYKLGFTSAAKQAAMGIRDPIHGTLLAPMRLPAGPPLSLAPLIHPKIEPEVAFVLGRALSGPSVTAHEVLAATASVHPALDVLDSRFEGFKFALPDVIADNASGAAFVLGPPSAPMAYAELGLARAEFYRNGQLLSAGAGRDVMGNPAEAVAWLARQLAARGHDLPAGAVILSGSLVAPVDAVAGDLFEARIDGLGTVALRVETGAS